MVPPHASNLPSVSCSLNPAKIIALPLTFNECLLWSSCRQNGYHIFTLLFCLHFYKLNIVDQHDALKDIINQQGRSRPSSISSSSSSSSHLYFIAARKDVWKLAIRCWGNLPRQSKDAWKRRALTLNQRPPSNGLFHYVPSTLTSAPVDNDDLQQHIIKSLSNEFNNLVAVFCNSILRKQNKDTASKSMQIW